MSKIKESALELVGGTPVLKLNRYTEKAGITDATILAKLEYLNPAGSVTLLAICKVRLSMGHEISSFYG